MARLRMTCSHCGGENVKLDAWAEWDHENQQWTLGQTFDHAHCDDCDGETHIEEVEEEPVVCPT